MFMDISSEMIHGLLPVFLTSVLGANAEMVGLIEGVGEATVSISKLFSGWISMDFASARRSLSSATSSPRSPKGVRSRAHSLARPRRAVFGSGWQGHPRRTARRDGRRHGAGRPKQLTG
jgi:hypothetical protein